MRGRQKKSFIKRNYPIQYRESNNIKNPKLRKERQYKILHLKENRKSQKNNHVISIFSFTLLTEFSLFRLRLGEVPTPTNRPPGHGSGSRAGGSRAHSEHAFPLVLGDHGGGEGRGRGKEMRRMSVGSREERKESQDTNVYI